LILWLQSRLNNFTAFYSHPKKNLYEMSKSRGIMAISLYQKVETEMSKVFFIKIDHQLFIISQ